MSPTSASARRSARRRSSSPPASTTKIDRSTTVGALMTATPHTIGSDQTIAMAHAVMREHGVRHLPVLRSGRLVGVLSQRDLYFLETISGVDISIDEVAEAMTPDVFTTQPTATVREIAQVMAENKYGCAVVVDPANHGTVLGIFTVTDALLHLANSLPDV